MSPYELWQQAKGDRTEYRRLLFEHGLLVPVQSGQCICPEGDPANDCSRLAAERRKCPVHGVPAPSGQEGGEQQ